MPACRRIGPEPRYHSSELVHPRRLARRDGWARHPRCHPTRPRLRRRGVRLAGRGARQRLLRPSRRARRPRLRRRRVRPRRRRPVVERSVEGLPEAALVVQVPEPLQALRRLAEALRDAHPIPAVGITGNVGKTTTKEATAAALGARYRGLKSAASFNYEIGVPLTVLTFYASHEVAVVEIGFYVPGEIADLCSLVRPRIGVITAIPERPVHFSRTPSVEAIAAGKAELIASLPADGLALLNADDPRVRSLAPRTKARVVLYGESSDAELRATDVR